MDGEEAGMRNSPFLCKSTHPPEAPGAATNAVLMLMHCCMRMQSLSHD